MNGSDNTRRPADAPFAHAGIGLPVTNRCGVTKCGAQLWTLAGTGWRLHRGLRCRVCPSCKAAIDSRAAA